MTSHDTTPPTFERLSHEQLQIYAKELQEHFHKVHQLHQELELKNQRLEQRLQELTALNRLFQEHLRQRFAVRKAYREVLEGLQWLATEANALAERARSQPLPDLLEMPDFRPERAEEEKAGKQTPPSVP